MVPRASATRKRLLGRAGRVSVAAALLTTACTGPGEPGSGVIPQAQEGDLPSTTPCPHPLEAGGGAGTQLPDITLTCLGQPTELALRELPAVPVVLTFWASWCGICREEMPELQRLADEVGDQVLFLGVNAKDGERPARFLLDDLGITHANLYDPSGRSLDLLPSPGVPTTLVLAPDGEIVDKVIGATDQERLRTLLTERLGVQLADGPSAATD
ncbi:TlpA disulfide reductase family protein [Blastococcus sp. TF02-8]|uniref:TlpA family protein disulfide reductase n=2 Tax=Blastococcus TaxID=38501 RepID=UPI002101706D|nr:TlpA disulfide reductase family protein [Blastococcus sp. TF02-8]